MGHGGSAQSLTPACGRGGAGQGSELDAEVLLGPSVCPAYPLGWVSAGPPFFSWTAAGGNLKVAGAWATLLRVLQVGDPGERAVGLGRWVSSAKGIAQGSGLEGW